MLLLSCGWLQGHSIFLLVLQMCFLSSRRTTGSRYVVWGSLVVAPAFFVSPVAPEHVVCARGFGATIIDGHRSPCRRHFL